MGGYSLGHVALAVRDPVAARRFFADWLGLAPVELAAGGDTLPAFRLNRSAIVLAPLGHPWLEGSERSGVDHVGLVADDPRAEAARHGLAVQAGAAAVGLGGVAQAVLQPSATGGYRTRFVGPLDLPRPVGAAVRGIDHIGIASDDNEAVRRLFVERLGCPVESSQTDLEIRTLSETFVSDKYPVVHIHRPPEVLGGLRTVFVSVGDCELEFLQDYDPSLKPGDAGRQGPGNTKGDQGAIARYVARFGAGLHHIAFRTDDIDGLLQRLDGHGCRLIDKVGRPGGRASRIGFVHPAAFGGGLVVHFVERSDG